MIPDSSGSRGIAGGDRIVGLQPRQERIDLRGLAAGRATRAFHTNGVLPDTTS